MYEAGSWYYLSLFDTQIDTPRYLYHNSIHSQKPNPTTQDDDDELIFFDVESRYYDIFQYLEANSGTVETINKTAPVFPLYTAAS